MSDPIGAHGGGGGDGGGVNGGGRKGGEGGGLNTSFWRLVRNFQPSPFVTTPIQEGWLTLELASLRCWGVCGSKSVAPMLAQLCSACEKFMAVFRRMRLLKYGRKGGYGGEGLGGGSGGEGGSGGVGG